MSSAVIACLAVITCAFGCGSDATTRFPCGKGTCALDSQICVIAGTDKCSTCIAAPPAYTSNPSCEAVPAATDDAFGDTRCVDHGLCSEVEGGAVVTCAEANWGCG